MRRVLSMRRAPAVLVLLLTFVAVELAGPASAASPSLAPVVAALKKSPVYIDPAAGQPQVTASKLLAVTPKGAYFASLPTADIAATADPKTGSPADPAALPALLTAQLGGGGTVVVLVGGKLYGASTTAPGSLPDALGSAQATLPRNGDGTAALIALMRSLAGSGTLTDTTGPSHAGGPVGAGLLIAMAIVAGLGALALWWWLRRPPRTKPKRRRRAPRPLGDLVEIDHRGNVIKHTPARDRQT
jgi:hypothetical protein